MYDDEMKDMHEDKNINEKIARQSGGIISMYPNGVIELKYKKKAEVVRLSLI